MSDFMNRSDRLIEKVLSAQGESTGSLFIGGSLSEEMISKDNIGTYRREGSDFLFVVDSKEQPRCANFVDSNKKLIAKVKIPTSKCKTVEILKGDLSDKQKNDAVSLFNTIIHGMYCWKLMIAFIIENNDRRFQYEVD